MSSKTFEDLPFSDRVDLLYDTLERLDQHDQPPFFGSETLQKLLDQPKLENPDEILDILANKHDLSDWAFSKLSADFDLSWLNAYVESRRDDTAYTPAPDARPLSRVSASYRVETAQNVISALSDQTNFPIPPHEFSEFRHEVVSADLSVPEFWEYIHLTHPKSSELAYQLNADTPYPWFNDRLKELRDEDTGPRRIPEVPTPELARIADQFFKNLDSCPDPNSTPAGMDRARTVARRLTQGCDIEDPKLSIYRVFMGLHDRSREVLAHLNPSDYDRDWQSELIERFQP